MKNALYFILPVIAVAFLTWGVVKWGVQPKGVGVLKPSFFPELDELGAVIYRRFFTEVDEHQVFIWGVDPAQPEHQKIVVGFLLAAQSGGQEFSKLLVDRSLPLVEAWLAPWSVEVLDFRSDHKDLEDRVSSLVAAGEKVVLLTQYGYTSQKISGPSLSKSLSKKLGREVFSVTTLQPAFNSAQEADLRPVCDMVENEGLGELGCLNLHKSRMIYRDSPDFPRGQWVAMMDRWPTMDLLLFLRFNP